MKLETYQQVSKEFFKEFKTVMMQCPPLDSIVHYRMSELSGIEIPDNRAVLTDEDYNAVACRAIDGVFANNTVMCDSVLTELSDESRKFGESIDNIEYPGSKDELICKRSLLYQLTIKHKTKIRNLILKCIDEHLTLDTSTGVIAEVIAQYCNKLQSELTNENLRDFGLSFEAVRASTNPRSSDYYVGIITATKDWLTSHIDIMSLALYTAAVKSTDTSDKCDKVVKFITTVVDKSGDSKHAFEEYRKESEQKYEDCARDTLFETLKTNSEWERSLLTFTVNLLINEYVRLSSSSRVADGMEGA